MTPILFDIPPALMLNVDDDEPWKRVIWPACRRLVIELLPFPHFVNFEKWPLNYQERKWVSGYCRVGLFCWMSDRIENITDGCVLGCVNLSGCGVRVLTTFLNLHIYYSFQRALISSKREVYGTTIEELIYCLVWTLPKLSPLNGVLTAANT